MIEVFANYVRANARVRHVDREIAYSRDWQTQFIRIYMPDKKEKWYRTDANDPRFSQDIAELLKETHGDKAYLYALERIVSDDRSIEEVNLWKAVLTLLDKEK